MRFKPILLSLISLMFLFACELFETKEPERPSPQLPPITQTGANTFGCLINGNLFVNKLGQCAGNDLTGQFDSPSQTFGTQAQGLIQSVDSGGNCYFVQFGLRLDSGETTYYFDNNYNGVLFSDRFRVCEYYAFNGQIPIDGFIKINKIDHQNYFVAGEFAFTLVNSTCDTVRITDGRFDVKYGY